MKKYQAMVACARIFQPFLAVKNVLQKEDNTQILVMAAFCEGKLVVRWSFSEFLNQIVNDHSKSLETPSTRGEARPRVEVERAHFPFVNGRCYFRDT